MGHRPHSSNIYRGVPATMEFFNFKSYGIYDSTPNQCRAYGYLVPSLGICKTRLSLITLASVEFSGPTDHGILPTKTAAI